MSTSRDLVMVMLAATVFAMGCGGGRTVSGPESETLLPAVTGYILVDRPPGAITAIALPSLKETVVRPADKRNPNDVPSIHALSGPDAEGRIAYIEDHFFVANERNQRHLLKTIRLDGTQDIELFTRPGNAMWATSAAGNGEIGKHLAISPAKGRIAFLSGLKSAQMPGALFSEGDLEIWDAEKKVGEKPGIRALDQNFGWFPDGKRLAYVKLVEPKPAYNWIQEGDAFGKSFKGWSQVPAVFVYDVETKTDLFLHVGRLPVVSVDGQVVIVRDLETTCRSVDVLSGKVTPANWPGAWGGAIASPLSDIQLVWCFPTQGAKVKYTENNSPLRGPKQMLALKLVRANSNEFQTVVPYIDPRTEVSFGVVRPKE